MKILKGLSIVFIALLVMAGYGYAQSDQTHQLAIPLSNPGKPGQLKCDLINGTINVSGYNGKEVIIRYSGEQRIFGRHHSDEDVPKGMHRVTNNSMQLEAKEDNNTVTINPGIPNRSLTLDIQVPKNFSLNLANVNGGTLKVKNVDGEFDISNVNGSIELTNVSGSVNANTVNGKIVANLEKISNNPMAFTTLNGKVDVTLPASAKFTARMKTERGDIYTDFDMNMTKENKAKVTTTKQNGVFKVSVDKWMYGEVNGGGPEIIFKSFNGDIYIRKK